MAGDSSEAKVLLDVAYEHLNSSEDHEEAHKSGLQALKLAEGAKDSSMVADCIRLLVKVQCLKADVAKFDIGSEALSIYKETIKEADRLVDVHLEKFTAANDKLAMGKMQLCAAELYLAASRGRKRKDALKAAKAALQLFEELGAKEMQATVQEKIALLCVEAGDRPTAEENAAASLVFFKQSGDFEGEARAYHASSLAKSLEDTYIAKEEGLRFAKEAMSIYHEKGLKRKQALELVTIAKLGLEMGHPEEALPVVKGALDMMLEWEVPDAKASQALALSVIVETLIVQEQENQAQRLARECLQRFQKTADRRQEIMAQDCYAQALLAKGNPEEALRSAKEALTLAVDAGDLEWEGQISMTLCRVQLVLKEFKAALISAWDAVALFRSQGDLAPKLAEGQFLLSEVLAMMGDAEASFKCAYTASHLFNEVGDVKGEVKALLLAATDHLLLDDKKEAMSAITLAKDISVKAGETRCTVDALVTLVEVHLQNSDFEQALVVANERKDVMTAAGYEKEVAKAVSLIAEVHTQAGDDGMAAKTARDGLRIARSASDRGTEINLLLQCVQSEIKRTIDEYGSFEEAPKTTTETCMKMAKDAAALAKRHGSGRLRAPAHFWVAQTLMLNGDDATVDVEEALQIYRLDADRGGEAHTRVLMAQINYQQSNAEKAEASINAAMQIFQEDRDKQGMDIAKRVYRIIRPVQVRQVAQQQMVMQPQAAEIPDASPAQSLVAGKPQKMTAQMVKSKLTSLVEDTLTDTSVDQDSPLMDLGMDSLSSVQFRNEVSSTFGLKLSASLIFDYPSISTLTSHITELTNES